MMNVTIVPCADGKLPRMSVDTWFYKLLLNTGGLQP